MFNANEEGVGDAGEGAGSGAAGSGAAGAGAADAGAGASDAGATVAGAGSGSGEGDQGAGGEGAGEGSGNGQGAAAKFNDAFGTKLASDLSARWSRDEQARRDAATARNAPVEGEVEKPLTRSEMQKMQNEQARSSKIAAKRKSWRDGLSDLTSKTIQIGNHSGMINDQATYDDFEKYMNGMINDGKLAPRDFYILKNIDRIIADERAHAVRETTKRLKGGRTPKSGDQGGRGSGQRTQPSTGIPGRELSTEEYMKQHNRAGYDRIMSTAKD